MHRRRPRALLAMYPGVARRLFDEPIARRLADLVDVDTELIVTDFGSPTVHGRLATTEVLVSSWGCPPLTASVLAAAPRLRAVVHAAGSVKGHVTDACWERGLRVSSAAAANALPVAEYTVAAILLANKRVLEIAAQYRENRGRWDWEKQFPGLGNYRKTVGLIGASRVGRRVIELLRSFDLEVMLADPYITTDSALELGVRLVSLDDLLDSCDVVSVHAPALPETRNMIDAAALARMRDGAVLINTARAALVDQKALTKELESGRIRAVLDVTEPEPLSPGSPLYDLPNVVVTPHVAGSLGNELARMAESALDEVDRYTRGLPFTHPVTPDDLIRSA